MMADEKSKQIHDLEQGFALMAESLPPMIRRRYNNLIKEGFDKDQALGLVKAYLHGLAGGKLS